MTAIAGTNFSCGTLSNSKYLLVEYKKGIKVSYLYLNYLLLSIILKPQLWMSLLELSTRFLITFSAL